MRARLMVRCCAQASGHSWAGSGGAGVNWAALSCRPRTTSCLASKRARPRWGAHRAQQHAQQQQAQGGGGARHAGHGATVAQVTAAAVSVRWCS
jgi:hypothetical protein